MDVVPERDEQFRQFQAAHLERQTNAMERTMRHTGAIRGLLTIWFALTLIAALIVVVLNAQS